MTVDTEALIAAVRAGDIKAAQALLPVDPIVKRAREICGRHFGNPAMYLRGECDDGPQMGAVTQAIRSAPLPPPTEDHLLRLARAACYFAITEMVSTTRWDGFLASDYLSGEADQSSLMLDMLDVMRAA